MSFTRAEFSNEDIWRVYDAIITGGGGGDASAENQLAEIALLKKGAKSVFKNVDDDEDIFGITRLGLIDNSDGLSWLEHVNDRIVELGDLLFYTAGNQSLAEIAASTKNVNISILQQRNTSFIEYKDFDGYPTAAALRVAIEAWQTGLSQTRSIVSVSIAFDPVAGWGGIITISQVVSA